jgi:dTDP-4-dehydrorhamnose reductase
MRIVVTGTKGQVATALAERGKASGVDVVLMGRPALDLTQPDHIFDALSSCAPDIIVNAAAYTAVDKAEDEPELAFAINAQGAGAVAAAAHRLSAPVIHLSTDYVFDGDKREPYIESDQTACTGVYGASKLAGERAVAAANPHHVILRTAWVYSPFGANFVKTMLRLASSRDEIGVVDDQRGNPSSALDIAEAVITIARQLSSTEHQELFGIFHLAGGGEATWAELASQIFECSRQRGGPAARVRKITTAEFPTRARRPADSRLDCAKVMSAYAVALPEWRASIRDCVDRLIPGP